MTVQKPGETRNHVTAAISEQCEIIKAMDPLYSHP